MAAYGRVYNSRHLQADCHEPGSAPEPTLGNRVQATFFTCRDHRRHHRHVAAGPHHQNVDPSWQPHSNSLITHHFSGPDNAVGRGICMHNKHPRLTASFPRTNWVSWYKTICTLLQTDNDANTSSLNFYRTDGLPDVQPTVSKHWKKIYEHNKSKKMVFTFQWLTCKNSITISDTVTLIKL